MRERETTTSASGRKSTKSDQTEVDVEKRRQTRRVYRANIRALEFNEQHKQRRAAEAASDARCYARIKVNAERYSHRLELARQGDRKRRKTEEPGPERCSSRDRRRGSRRRMAWFGHRPRSQGDPLPIRRCCLPHQRGIG